MINNVLIIAPNVLIMNIWGNKQDKKLMICLISCLIMSKFCDV